MADKVTITTLKEMKYRDEKIAMLTAYDFGQAELLDDHGVEVLLIGDSLAMVVLGYENTLAVTVDDMLYHTKAVARGTKRALVVGDMPFLSYQVNAEEAMRNAGRFLQAGAEAVKIEGGVSQAATAARLVQVGIPVMGHIGLTPQSVNQLGGYKVRGKGLEEAKWLFEDAKALDEAGAFAIVLECVPMELARLITEEVSVPTIGIGAGPFCDGQVLVTHDLLGLFSGFTPKFSKQYAKLNAQAADAIAQYVGEVKAGTFPDREHSFTMDADLASELRKRLSSE